MSSTLESYELIRFAEAFEARLATAGEMLTGRPGLDAEKSWLSTALELVRVARAPTAGVLDRVKDLPELEEAREEYAFHQQGLWVDALEKLHAGITFTASSRAPVIEALFPHLKFPQLRRAPREAVLEYATSYERRTKSAYVTRIFGREDFALVRPVMEQVLTAHTAWRSSHEPGPLSLEQEALLREELVTLGRKLDQSLRQARLLAEAALVPAPTVYEAAGLNLKPKRRAGRGLALSDDALSGFDEPVDSMEPTEAELAEVAALDAGGDIASPAAPESAAASPAGPVAGNGDVGVEAAATGDGGSVERQDASTVGVEDGAGANATDDAASSDSEPHVDASATELDPASGSNPQHATAPAGQALSSNAPQGGSDIAAVESTSGSVEAAGVPATTDGASSKGRDKASASAKSSDGAVKTDGADSASVRASSKDRDEASSSAKSTDGAVKAGGADSASVRASSKERDAASSSSKSTGGEVKAGGAASAPVRTSSKDRVPASTSAKGDAAPPASEAAPDEASGGSEDGTASETRDEAAAAPRGARRGRKKAEATESAAPEATKAPPKGEAQAPRVRKKQAPPQSAPSTPGAETP